MPKEMPLKKDCLGLTRRWHRKLRVGETENFIERDNGGGREGQREVPSRARELVSIRRAPNFRRMAAVLEQGLLLIQWDDGATCRIKDTTRSYRGHTFILFFIYIFLLHS